MLSCDREKSKMEGTEGRSARIEGSTGVTVAKASEAIEGDEGCDGINVGDAVAKEGMSCAWSACSV
jgi:hypothetical protein